jgi:hypothetical protein
VQGIHLLDLRRSQRGDGTQAGARP